MSIGLVTRFIWSNPSNRDKRTKKIIAAIFWQLRKRIFGSARLIILPNSIIFKAYPDCVVSSSLIYADWPEFYELMFLRKNLNKNDAIIDVGANVGHFSLLLVDIVGENNVIAFEPTPISYKRLTENWRLNGFNTNGLFQKAIGSYDGSVYIENTTSPVTTNTIEYDSYKDQMIKVQLKKLDNIRGLFNSKRVGLLKIDVEGKESDVIRGAQYFIKNDRPKFIMFESLEGNLDKDIKSIFYASDYVVFQLDDKGIPDFANYFNQNLFATPLEFKDHILI